jgi:KUP system potassium uptake protein
VLSAIEGVKDAPGVGHLARSLHRADRGRHPGSAVPVQSRGTAGLAKFFGPITAVWFLSLGVMGLIHIFDDPTILRAFAALWYGHAAARRRLPRLHHPGQRLPGRDRGRGALRRHGPFRQSPIRAGWLCFVLPA